MKRMLLMGCALLGCILACTQSTQQVIVITATFVPSTQGAQMSPTQIVVPASTPIQIADAQANANPSSASQTYSVRPGDTLSGIAAQNGLSIAALLRLNTLVNPDALEVGQVINLPAQPTTRGSNFRILPDSRLVRAPGSAAFDIDEFIAAQTGYIRTAIELADGQLLTAAQIVKRVALEYSVDPRLLLALIEFKGGWLTQREPSETARTIPLGAGASPLGFEREGLYRQLTWAADQLNFGYYGWKGRGLDTYEFTDGTQILIDESLNAGTVGVQHMLSQFNSYPVWQGQVSASGFAALYTRLFGDPFTDAVEPHVPSPLTQPSLVLPFPEGQTWFYTGGPHGGWGAGSAWASIDFAPPDDLTTKTTACYLSDFFATAIVAGVVARVDEGTVILDLDGDGDESTGWTILYLHMASRDRIAQGTRVRIGDRIGRPSCEGGYSNGTHMHIARRYNGEWIPADCSNCRDWASAPEFTMDGWEAVGFINQEYQGLLVNGAEERIAEQGRQITENRVTR